MPQHEWFMTYDDYLKEVLGLMSDKELEKFMNSPSWGCLTMQSPEQTEDRSPEPDPSQEPSQ